MALNKSANRGSLRWLSGGECFIEDIKMKDYDFKDFTYLTEQNVRIFLVNDEPWFVLKDIYSILGLTDTSKLSKRIKEENLTRKIFVSGGQKREQILVNEKGLYRIIFRSNKKEAERFQDWVFDEVLPSIRKTGKYEDKENKFEALCPVKFGKEELKKEMGKRINSLGGQKKGGLAYYYAYLKFGDIIGFDFYHHTKKNNIKPIRWLKDNNYYEQFCELVCTNKI